MISPRLAVGLAGLFLLAYCDVRYKQAIPSNLLGALVWVAIALNAIQLGLAGLLLSLAIAAGVMLFFSAFSAMGWLGDAEPLAFSFMALISPQPILGLPPFLLAFGLAGLLQVVYFLSLCPKDWQQAQRLATKKVPFFPFLFAAWALLA